MSLPRSGVNDIVARTSYDMIVAIAAHDQIITAPGVDVIVAALAVDRIGTMGAKKAVVTCRSDNRRSLDNLEIRDLLNDRFTIGNVIRERDITEHPSFRRE